MDSSEPIDSEPLQSDPLETLSRAFSDQLLACLDECARGRKGLFSNLSLIHIWQPTGGLTSRFGRSLRRRRRGRFLALFELRLD